MYSNQNYELVYKKHCNDQNMIVVMPENWKKRIQALQDLGFTLGSCNVAVIEN